VTAGNASGICDGAAANVVVSEKAVEQHGIKPLARVLSYHVVAVEPTIMGASFSCRRREIRECSLYRMQALGQ
jgi:acetyl-CoA acetyltransferase